LDEDFREAVEEESFEILDGANDSNSQVVFWALSFIPLLVELNELAILEMEHP